MAVANNLFRTATGEAPDAVTVAMDQPITIRWATEADEAA